MGLFSLFGSPKPKPKPRPTPPSAPAERPFLEDPSIQRAVLAPVICAMVADGQVNALEEVELSTICRLSPVFQPMPKRQCDELIAAAKADLKDLQIGFVHRYTSVGSAAKQLIDSGDLGDLYHAKAHLHLRRSIPGLGGWFTTKALSGGGALIDLGVHLIDLSLHLLGQPTAVAVTGKAYSKFGVKKEGYVFESMWAGPPRLDGVFDVDDHATAMITFDSGATLDLQVSWACNLPDGSLPDSMMAVLGDHGGVSFELFGDHLLLRNEIAGRNADSKLALPAAEAMQLQMTDFAHAVAEGRPGVGATPDEGRRVQAIVDAIYESNEKNAPVTLG